MNLSKSPAAESRVGPSQGSAQDPRLASPPSNRFDTAPANISTSQAQSVSGLIHIGKMDGPGNDGSHIFTMSLGDETIELLPFRSWGQLDSFKWTVRGKLPGTPAGLEVTPDHVKIVGETVSIQDVEGCSKLEKLFNDWIQLEADSLELARKKAQTKTQIPNGGSAKPVSGQSIRYEVELDKRGQVHLKCLRGSELLAAIGLTVAGFNGLASQGLLRRPRTIDIGALHDWIELDGELCSFEHGNNEAAKLEKLLNGRYLPESSLGKGKDILVFANPASPTGFDVQFTVTVGGVPENRRRTLNDATLELLQEPVRCALLQPGLIIKLSPPTLIFKRKTPDGGETYLEKNAANQVMVRGDDRQERIIDLSQPVNYARLTVVELTAILNHPAINQHSQTSSRAASVTEPLPQSTASTAKAEPVELISSPLSPPKDDVVAGMLRPTPPLPPEKPPLPLVASTVATPLELFEVVDQPLPSKPPILPNAWLEPVLRRPSIRYDWFGSLVYAEIARHFGNSNEAPFGSGKCWAVSLTECADLEDPAFQGVFLTQKGGLGILTHGRMARFHKGVAFLGTRKSVLEGIDIDLVAVAISDANQVAFIVSDEFRAKFGVPEQTVAAELDYLRAAGCNVLSIGEVLESPEPLDIVWSVPAEQADPGDPQALETIRPQVAADPEL